MVKRIIFFAFILLFLNQSCVVYQNQSASLGQAVNKGKVRMVGYEGEVYKFDNISVIDSVYYGIGREYISRSQYITKEGARTPLDSTKFSGIFIKDTKKSKKRTVWTIVGVSIPVAYLVVGGIAALFFFVL